MKLVALRCGTGCSLQSFPEHRGRITERRFWKYNALHVRAASGTFVPHGSERTLGRYLTAPVTPFHHHHRPLTTCCVKERARAFAAHDCARGTHSHVLYTAFQRNSPTAGSYVALTFSSSLSHIVRNCWDRCNNNCEFLVIFP